MSDISTDLEPVRIATMNLNFGLKTIKTDIFSTMKWANMAEEGGKIIEGGEKRKGRQSPEQRGAA